MQLITRALLVTSLVLAGCSAEQETSTDQRSLAPQQPNILFILVDDMGFNDLGANGGGGQQTPSLDAFASQGVRFTRNYVDSTCSSSRAGILTGTAPAARGFRPDGLGISPEVPVLGEMLQEAGYSTHHIGKWHLGYASRLAWPHAQGFDSFFGFLNQFLLRGPHPAGKLNIRRPTYRDPWLQVDDEPPQAYEGHLSDILLQRALDFLDNAPLQGQPWFLNFWTFLPHNPQEPAARFAARFPDTSAGLYAASLAQMDEGIGRLLQKLEDRGLDKTTLVIFASDNGGSSQHTSSNLPFAGSKMTFLEGGVRTPLIIRWPDGRGRGQVVDEVVSYMDYLPTIVSAAGGSVPPTLPGRDIHRILDGEPLLQRPLFWDAGDLRSRAWAVLSGDGRWRLSRFFSSEPQLNSLVKDPSGSVDVSAQEPDRLAELQGLYTTWAEESRRVVLEFDRLDDNGRGMLTGESLQRAPGFGGYTFAIAVVPQPAETPQVIASQPGQWSLVQRSGELNLQMNGIELSAEAPPSGRCSTVVVSSHHRWDPFAPQRSYALVDLYIDDQHVAGVREEQPSMHPDTYARPTVVGQGARGGRRFKGELGVPLVLNERVVFRPTEGRWSDSALGASLAGMCETLSGVKGQPSGTTIE